jgi:diguanylate cyclase (GGDEF)-like protein
MELLRIEHYDLIVVDLRTPGVDSAEFVRDIRGRRRIPIMVAGLRTDRRRIADALAAGADEFLYIDGAPEVSRLLLRHTVDRARMSAMYEEGHPEWERDFLTGADSRRAFSAHYAQRVERSRQTGEGLVVIRLEVEDLERMNAAYGAHIGDTVLREVARMLQRAVRATDSVARLEAGQFAVLLVGASGRRAEQVANQIQALAAEQRFPERPNLRIRLRVGWAELGADADPLEAAERRLGDVAPA